MAMAARRRAALAAAALAALTCGLTAALPLTFDVPPPKPVSLVERTTAFVARHWPFSSAQPRPSPDANLAAATLLLTEARSRLDALEATLLGPLRLKVGNASTGDAAPPPPPPSTLAQNTGPPALAALAALAALSYAAASALDSLRLALVPAVGAAITLARAPVIQPVPPQRGSAAATLAVRAHRALRGLRPAARDCAEAATRLASHGVLIVALARHLSGVPVSGLGAAAGWLLSAFGAAGPPPSQPPSAPLPGPSPGQAMLLCAAGWAAIGWAASDAARWAEGAGVWGWLGEVAASSRLLGRAGSSGSGADGWAPADAGSPTAATPSGAALARLARARFAADSGGLAARLAPPGGGWCTPLGAGTPAAAAGAGAGPFHVSCRAGGPGDTTAPKRRHSAGADGADAPPLPTLVRLPPPRPSPPPPPAPSCDLPACRICWVAPRSVAFLPCGHVGSCAGCTLRLFDAASGGGGGSGGNGGGTDSTAGVPCPFCGQAVSDVARVFIV